MAEEKESQLSISKFKSQVTGFTKTSLMEVEFISSEDPEHIFKSSGKEIFNNIRDLKYTCESARLPGYIFKTENRLIGGMTSEMPVGFEHERLTLSFLCRNEMQERVFFDSWIESIQDNESLRFEYYNNYICDIHVYVYNERSEKIYAVKYFHCYPNLITAQGLNWAENNVLRLTVDFSYEKYIPLSIESLKMS